MSETPNEYASANRGAPLILLADDEPHITLVLARKLCAHGYEVVTAEDGEEAFELAQERTPALVITDLQMPYVTGIELARSLKADEATAATPVIMLTARGYVLDPTDLGSTNIRYVMSKPFSAREIVEKVVDLLSDGLEGYRKSA
jgi:two-component system alkaline phosphatase synthesis response regulator PhoP